MVSRRRTARINCPGIARTLVVALLGLVLLCGLLPTGALSAAQTCRMECCAGKPQHEAGACSAIIETPSPAGTAQATEASGQHTHHDGMAMNVTVVETTTDEAASSDHCRSAEPSSAQPQQATTQSQQARQRSAAAHALTRPCSMECAAAILSLVQLRRPRSAAALVNAVRPRPPTLRSRAASTQNLLTSSTDRRRQSRPRAPPVQPSA